MNYEPISKKAFLAIEEGTWIRFIRTRPAQSVPCTSEQTFEHRALVTSVSRLASGQVDALAFTEPDASSKRMALKLNVGADCIVEVIGTIEVPK